MKISLIQVGKTADKNLDVLINDYVKRIGHYLSFEIKTIPALKLSQNISVEQQKTSEGELILAAIDGKANGKKTNASAFVVLLDERGEQLRSIEFAKFIQQKQSASRDIVFVIGGPFGFSKEVYDRADSMLSLSKMTFSHQMIRLLFTEQIYRALTILHGEKYHHE